MLKKLLPILSKLKNLLRPQVKTPEQEKLQNQSPNLLLDSDTQDLKSKILSQSNEVFVKFFQRAAAFIQIIFVVLLIWNISLSYKVSAIKTENDGLEKSISRYKPIEKGIDDITVKTEIYKNIKSERVEMGKNIEVIINGAKDLVNLTSITSNKTSAALTAKTTEVVNFSLLLNKYLENKSVKAIILDSATKNSSDQTFTINLTIQYK